MMKIKFSVNNQDQLELDFRSNIQKEAESNYEKICKKYYEHKEKLDKEKEKKEKAKYCLRHPDKHQGSLAKMAGFENSIDRYNYKIKLLESSIELDKLLIESCEKHYRNSHGLRLEYSNDKVKSTYI